MAPVSTETSGFREKPLVKHFSYWTLWHSYTGIFRKNFLPRTSYLIFFPTILAKSNTDNNMLSDKNFQQFFFVFIYMYDIVV
jgi:hypothetical protein